MKSDLRKTGSAVPSSEQVSYLDYKLETSKKYIRVLMLFLSFLNAMLLIPDLLYLNSADNRLNTIIIRTSFSLILILVFFLTKDFKTFRLFSLVITLCELFAFLVFLFILSEYSHPDFLIQSMGVMTLILIVFLVPNRWAYMLFVATAGSVSFLILMMTETERPDPNQLWAAVVYIATSIILCSVYAWNTERHQASEFAAKNELEHIGSTDFLTNTANRMKLREEAVRWLDFCRRNGFPLCLVFIDVDGLKVVNDQHGHLAGDTVLSNLAKLVPCQLRSTDILARWGGDEFVLLLPNAPPPPLY